MWHRPLLITFGWPYGGAMQPHMAICGSLLMACMWLLARMRWWPNHAVVQGCSSALSQARRKLRIKIFGQDQDWKYLKFTPKPSWNYVFAQKRGVLGELAPDFRRVQDCSWLPYWGINWMNYTLGSDRIIFLSWLRLDLIARDFMKANWKQSQYKIKLQPTWGNPKA